MMTHDKNKRNAIENNEKTATSFRSWPGLLFAFMPEPQLRTADRSAARVVSFPDFSRTPPTTTRRLQKTRRRRSSSHEVVGCECWARLSTRARRSAPGEHNPRHAPERGGVF